MNNKNSCIAIYSTCQAVENILDKLQKAGFDLRLISVMGKGFHGDAHAIGFYTSNDQNRYLGAQSAFWNKLWDLTADVAFFWIPNFGPLIASGPIVPLLVRRHTEIEVGGRFNMFQSALYSVGVPKDNILQYDTALKTDKFLLVAHGQRDLVENACDILHSDKQQVTVHRS